MSTTHELAVPFLVSCTGHRDPLERDKLTEGVRSVLRELLERIPHTPLRLFTGLAEGAD